MMIYLGRSEFELDGTNPAVGTIAYQYGYIIDNETKTL